MRVASFFRKLPRARAALLTASLLTAASCMHEPTPSVHAIHAASGTADWKYYNSDAGSTHYSPLDQITTRNVTELQVAWEYETGDAFGTGDAQSNMESNPLVVAGRLYAVSPKGRLICLDAATGKEVWTYNPAKQPVTTAHKSRGVAYWSDKTAERILFTFEGDLISIDARTGLPDSQFGTGGRVDMRIGLGRDPDTLTVGARTPGMVWEDLIVMGSTGNAPGDIRAFDIRTGSIRWTFHTIPHPGEPGAGTWPVDAWKTEMGANAWGGFALDTQRGIVYIPTASPGMLYRDFYGALRHGSNRFSDSLIALDAASGRRLWDFQSVHHDLWDRDFPCPPTLVTVRRSGQSIPAVAQPTKSGWLYILDRLTGEPLYPVVESPVPASDIPGEEAWPTQPLPATPEPFARQKLTPELLTSRTNEAHSILSKRLSQLRSTGQWEPPSLQGTIIFPGLDGGAEWGGAAYDPQTGLLYINSNEMAWTLTLKPRAAHTADTGGRSIYLNHCAACHGENLKGSPPTVPSLETARAIGHDPLVRQITAGGGRMPGFGSTLKTSQIEALTQFLLTGSDVPVADSEEGAGNSFAALARTFDEAYIFDGYKRLLDSDGYPAIKPPWGTLNAIDVNTARYAWKIPLGQYPELAAQGLSETGSENYGGAVVTAGGLLFIAATVYDNQFRAYDKRTGQLLWQTQLPAAGMATPATYAVNGRQFVVIAAGGGKDAKATPGGKLIAFALPAS